MNTQQVQTQTAPKSIANFLNSPSTAKFLQDTLAEKKPEFIANLISLCDSDANIALCEPSALMKCAMNATALNLPLNKSLGYAYVIAYKDKGVLTPHFQIGYKGLIQLAIRTGAYRYINAVEVREGEIIRNKITGELTVIGEFPDAEIIGYISYLELMSGFKASFYMSKDQIEEHALRFSKMYQADKKYGSCKSKWSDPLARPSMCLKTVLIQLLGTYGLMTTDFARAFESDSDEVSNSHRGNVVDITPIPQDDPQPTISQNDETAPEKKEYKTKTVQL